MDLFNYATCCVFTEFDGVSVYLGEDDNVDCDFDNMVIYDNFSGEWASLDGMPLAIDLVCRNDTTSIYTCPILLNGEYTNPRILTTGTEKAGECSGLGAELIIKPVLRRAKPCR